jgi:hypothetical protein
MKRATLVQGIKLLTFIEQAGTSCEQLQDLLASGLFPELLHANFQKGIDGSEFRRVLGLKPWSTFSVTINFGHSVEDAVIAGKYDDSHEAFTTENFPWVREANKVNAEIVLAKFEVGMYSHEITRRLMSQGLRPAILQELLALGEFHPSLQLRFRIAALGTTLQKNGGSSFTPMLYNDSGQRCLGFLLNGCEWNSTYRFAFVRG